MQMELGKLIPEITTVITAALTLVIALFLPQNRQWVAGVVALVGLLTAAIFTAPIFTAPPQLIFEGTYAYDGFAAFLKLISVLSAAGTIAVSIPFFRRHPREGELYAMVVFVALGVMLLSAAADIMLVAISLVLVSLASYVLVGYMTAVPRSQEAGLKYFIFGSVAGATMLYGLTFLYGFSGTTLLYSLPGPLSGASGPLLYAAIIFALAGLAFKATLAPMHLWTPDVYEGAPTPITAFISVGPKAAGFAVLARFLVGALPEGVAWPLLIAILAAVTMTLGNLQMFPQQNVKRLLAYSSIAQAGYLGMGIVAFPFVAAGREALLYYTLAYLFMNFGAFVVVQYVARRSGSEDIPAYAGLARRSPAVAIGFTLLLISLVGVPPLAGFFGKFLLFTAVIDAGYTPLAVVGILNSVISLYPYFRIVGPMFLGKPGPEWDTGKTSPLLPGIIAVCVAATVLLGVYPEPFLDLVRASTMFTP